MTVTLNEVAQLEQAFKNNSLPQLLKKWKDAAEIKELNKKDTVKFEVTSFKGDEKRPVIGKRIATNYAYHKDVWNGKDYRLTHIETGCMVLSGKKLNVVEAIKKFEQSFEGKERLHAALNEHGVQALRHLPEHIVQQYRDIYIMAKGA